jgi:hypothetical protein
VSLANTCIALTRGRRVELCGDAGRLLLSWAPAVVSKAAFVSMRRQVQAQKGTVKSETLRMYGGATLDINTPQKSEPIVRRAIDTSTFDKFLNGPLMA